MKKVLIGIGVVVGLFFLSAIVAGVAGAGKGSEKALRQGQYEPSIERTAAH